ncbi:MAG: hypothetical protein O7F73_20345, partial [Gammaproteobacteria bacterium]|nr:hypothetical protein [Gammaproteobacteria bacterium]
MADYDLIIRNGEIYDGSGAKATFTLAPIEAPSQGMNRDPQLWKSQLRMIDQAQQEGLDIRGQV